MNTETLKAWRARLTLTQQQAANALGMTLQGYQQMEAGKRFGTGTPVEIDHRTALACAAIESGVAPLGD